MAARRGRRAERRVVSVAVIIAAVVAAWPGIAALVVCICKCGAADDREFEKQFDARRMARAREEYRTSSGWKA